MSYIFLYFITSPFKTKKGEEQNFKQKDYNQENEDSQERKEKDNQEKTIGNNLYTVCS